jgi:hypothetical protein
MIGPTGTTRACVREPEPIMRSVVSTRAPRPDRTRDRIMSPPVACATLARTCASSTRPDAITARGVASTSAAGSVAAFAAHALTVCVTQNP